MCLIPSSTHTNLSCTCRLIPCHGKQGSSAVASMIGLLLRREKLTAMYPTIKAFSSRACNSYGLTSCPGGSSSKACHPDVLSCLFSLLTITATYFCAVCMIVGNLMMMKDMSPNALLTNGVILMNGVCMIVHMTAQSCLIRTGDRTTNSLRQVFAFLILTNLSIWILEVQQLSVKFSLVNYTLDSVLLPPLLMSLNRLHSALMFIHFWKSK